MTIAAIGPIAIPAVGPIAGSSPVAGSGGASAGGTSFAAQLGDGLNQLQQAQSKADDLGVKAATGNLADVHDYMIASTEAALTTQLTVAVRNKAVEAFNEILRMQA
jgi:flagellar hook-basal body complex protein FliE